jgi:hypothetical protein
MKFYNQKTGTVVQVSPRALKLLSMLVRDDDYRYMPDAEHWITVHPNGKEHKGTPVKINGAGEVIGGAGGRLTGKTFNPGSKSKDVEKPKAAEPLASGETPESPNYAASQKAIELSKTAQTLEEHEAALAAHRQAYVNSNNETTDKYHYAEILRHQEQIEKLKKKKKREDKKAFAASEQGQRQASIRKTFETSTPMQIAEHFKDKFGLDFENGTKNQTRYAENLKLWRQAYSSQDYEKAEHYYMEMLKGKGTYSFISSDEYNINSDRPSAKKMRQMLGHYNDVFENLQSRGFDIKGLMGRIEKITIAPIPPQRKTLGTAWRTTKGQFVAIDLKLLDKDKIDEIENRQQQRLEQGRPLWTVDGKDKIYSTIVHEMAHAIGIKQGSPGRLEYLLGKLHDEGGLGDFPRPAGYEHIPPRESEKHKNIESWIMKNISEYATDNIHETDAELAAMVMQPDYTPGRLPKVLEDHVYEMFNKKRD